MTSKPFIPFGRPMLDDAEVRAVSEVLSGTTLVHGPMTHAFEERFAERVGTRHAISVSSCTAGLNLTLLVRDVGAGSEVVVPAMTHVATAHSAEACGAKPVFVDVEAHTGNLDPDAFAAAISPRTAAVTVVHYLGLPCDMDRIAPVAAAAGAFVLEDCALAVDAAYGDRKAGALGLAGCFSFYPVKHMTAAEGGMITTDDDALAAALLHRRAFGYDRSPDKRQKPGIYDVTGLGLNARMNEVQAAIGAVQLGKLDGFQKARAENHRVLREGLAEVAEITVFNSVVGKARSSHYCLNAVLPRDGSIDRDVAAASLKAAGIGTSVHYPVPVPLLSYYREKYQFRTGQFPVAEWIANQTISLPVGPHLADGDAERIIEAVRAAVVEARVKPTRQTMDAHT